MARGEDLTFPADGGFAMPGFVARPDEVSSPQRGVVVIHEIFGLNDDIRRIATRFADEGYVAIAPDLFSRSAKFICVAKAMGQMRKGQGQNFRDLDAARAYLVSREGVSDDHVGVTGFCFGGGFALMWAVKAKVGATAPFYGDVPKDREKLRGVAPVVASFGGRDKQFAPKGTVLFGHLHSLAVPHDVVIYPEAGHSFMSRPPGHGGSEPGPILRALGSRMNAGYDERAATDAWRRVLAFFDKHLGAAEGT